ncbi:unnamed protein product [Miscanthus lutarioriparius]|uniref:NAC domain-containing protein n=1 Tax=Miscanthus lutarioriparius TaxID=422564 RepID=A0A811MPD6_9POAL|nr:unnamed protein product [Miscanthus lutarioriparius]
MDGRVAKPSHSSNEGRPSGTLGQPARPGAGPVTAPCVSTAEQLSSRMACAPARHPSAHRPQEGVERGCSHEPRPSTARAGQRAAHGSHHHPAQPPGPDPPRRIYHLRHGWGRRRRRRDCTQTNGKRRRAPPPPSSRPQGNCRRALVAARMRAARREVGGGSGVLRPCRPGRATRGTGFITDLLGAILEPTGFTRAVPGTGLEDDGYSRIWYFYHAKKFTNTRGKLSGYRQRAVTGGGGTCWHSEIRRKDVQGSGGGTFCTFSYGRKTEPSSRSIARMGWCMVEYDFVAADKKQDEAAADSSNYVLCKVYRSPRVKGNLASASSSTKKSSSKQTAKKRKAGGSDHPKAPPAKSIQQQEQVQQDTTACYQPQGVESEHGGDFNVNIEDINFYVDESMLRDELEQGLQQPIAEPETAVQRQRGAQSEHEEFTVEWLLRGEPQQPIIEPPPGHGGEVIQMPCGPVVPVVAEAIVEDMLGLGPETVYGQWSDGMTTASIPWSSYAPTTLYTGCSSVLQGSDPLQLPYLTC